MRRIGSDSATISVPAKGGLAAPAPLGRQAAHETPSCFGLFRGVVNDFLHPDTGARSKLTSLAAGQVISLA